MPLVRGGWGQKLGALELERSDTYAPATRRASSEAAIYAATRRSDCLPLAERSALSRVLNLPSQDGEQCLEHVATGVVAVRVGDTSRGSAAAAESARGRLIV